MMYVMADSQWSTSGAVGNLILANGTYSGQVKYDSGYTANVTVNEGAVWTLTGNATVSALVNNGTIATNGYTLTYSSLTGSGTITETAGIQQASFDENNSSEIYNLQGHRVKTPQKGIFIRDGKKWVVR